MRLLIPKLAKLGKQMGNVYVTRESFSHSVNRPEHLILPDDPSFLPEFAMPPLELLAELELGPDLPPLHLSGDSQSLTPFADRIVPSTPVPVGGLILPTSSPVDPGGFVLPGHRSSSVEGLADENVLGEWLYFK